MTTYPLSEAATIYAGDGKADVLGKGALTECVDVVRGLSDEERSSITIKMDDLDLTYGPAEVGELVRFLNDEDEGLSNKEIIGIAGSIE
jgi:hypothetical protein